MEEEFLDAVDMEADESESLEKRIEAAIKKHVGVNVLPMVVFREGQIGGRPKKKYKKNNKINKKKKVNKKMKRYNVEKVKQLLAERSKFKGEENKKKYLSH